MSTELLKQIMKNRYREESLVEQSPRQPLEEDRTPVETPRKSNSDIMLNTIRDLLERRQQ
jgi:hypothetical protein